MSKLVAGIDVSKDYLDIHLDGEDRRLPNNRDGFRAIARWFRDRRPDRVILEATGRYHRALLQSLHVERRAKLTHFCGNRRPKLTHLPGSKSFILATVSWLAGESEDAGSGDNCKDSQENSWRRKVDPRDSPGTRHLA